MDTMTQILPTPSDHRMDGGAIMMQKKKKERNDGRLMGEYAESFIGNPLYEFHIRLPTAIHVRGRCHWTHMVAVANQHSILSQCPRRR